MCMILVHDFLQDLIRKWANFWHDNLVQLYKIILQDFSTWVDQWNGLPRNVVMEQNYKTFKNKLAAALGDKLYWYPP